MKKRNSTKAWELSVNRLDLCFKKRMIGRQISGFTPWAYALKFIRDSVRHETVETYIRDTIIVIIINLIEVSGVFNKVVNWGHNRTTTATTTNFFFSQFKFFDDITTYITTELTRNVLKALLFRKLNLLLLASKYICLFLCEV